MRSVFIAIGIALFLKNQRFYRKGWSVTGRVRAIDKYISEHRFDSSTKRQFFFRAHVAYNYNGQEMTVTSSGSNEMNYKLKQVLPVLVLVSSAGEITNAGVADKSHKIISTILFLTGLVALSIHVYAADGSITVTSVAFIIATILGKPIARLMAKASSEDSNTNGIAKNSVMVETKAGYLKETSNHKLGGS